MRYRATFLVGFLTGYVIGARAGRERYEQMKKIARQAADHPAVQQAAGTAAAQATGLAKTATAKVSDTVQQRSPGLADAARKAGERLPGRKGKSAGAGPAGNGVPPVPAPSSPPDS